MPISPKKTSAEAIASRLGILPNQNESKAATPRHPNFHRKHKSIFVGVPSNDLNDPKISV